MSLDIMSVGIALDTTALAAGERDAVASLRHVAEAAEAMKQKADAAAAAAAKVAQAQKEQAAIQREVSAALAEGKRRAEALQVTEQNRLANEAAFEAQRQRRNASERVLGEGINQRAAAERAATEAMVAEASAARVLTATTEGVAAAKAKSVTGVRTLATAFSTLAASSIGLRGGLGSLVSTLGLMGPGAAVTIGVTAGVALIASAYESITGPARRAREEADKLVDSLNKSLMARLGLDVIADAKTLTAELKLANAELDKANRPRTGVGGQFGNGPVSGVDANAVTAAQERLTATSRAIIANNLKLIQPQLDAEKERLRLKEDAERKAEQAAARAAAAAKARAADLKLLQAIEQEIAIKDAAANKDALAYYNAKRALAELALQSELRGLESLTAAERKLFEERKRNLDPLMLGGAPGNRFSTYLTEGFGLTATVGYSDQAQRNTVALDARRSLASQPLLPPQVLDEAGKAIETRLSVAYEEAARNFQRSLTGAFEGLIAGAPDIGRRLGAALTGGIAGILSAQVTDSLTSAFKRLSPELQERLKGAAGVGLSGVVGGSVGYSSGSTGLGAASGVAAGSAFGLPGMIVGGVAGIVGGLLGSSKQAEEAARRMAEARKAFAVSLKSFTDEATGAATSLSRSTDAAIQRGEELKRQIPGVSLGGVGRDEVRKFGKDLEEYVASLGKVDAATKAMVARLEEEEKVRLQLVAISLDEREASLAGNERGALEARAARENAEVQRQLRNGEITIEIATRTSAVIEGELNKSIAALGDSAREATASLSESLVTRELQARARLAATDAETQAIEDQIRAEQYRIETERAIADGVDAAVVANQRRIQGLEQEAVAMERARKAEEDRTRLLKESAQYLSDLKAREFRATGQGAAASEFEQRARDQAELERAAQYGTDYVMEALRVQGLERADRDLQRRAQQEAEYAAAAASAAEPAYMAESRTSVNLAVGTSESTTNRLIGVVQSQLIYNQQTASNTAESAALLRRIANAIDRGALVELVDEGLAVSSSLADMSAGVPPGNR